ncbi:MAG: protein jag [Clostridiales bacterium]|nr:protein jag [Clostridiales bacterium]
MTLNSVETTGKTIEEAILVAVAQLGKSRDKLDIEVLVEPETSLFGLIKKKEAKIRATVKLDLVEKSKEYLEKLFELMGVEAQAQVTLEDDVLHAELVGKKIGVLIGKRGETLDSVRYLLSLYIGKFTDQKIKVVLDSEGYLAKREQALQKLAVSIAHKVKKTRRRVVLEPMNSYERRIIHSALQDDPYVKTVSEGEEPFRKVIVVLK